MCGVFCVDPGTTYHSEEQLADGLVDKADAPIPRQIRAVDDQHDRDMGKKDCVTVSWPLMGLGGGGVGYL